MLDDKTVAVETLAVLGVDQPRQPAPARGRETVRQFDTGGVQPALIEPAAANDGIAREKFFLAQHLGEPERHQQGSAHQRRHDRFPCPHPGPPLRRPDHCRAAASVPPPRCMQKPCASGIRVLWRRQNFGQNGFPLPADQDWLHNPTSAAVNVRCLASGVYDFLHIARSHFLRSHRGKPGYRKWLFRSRARRGNRRSRPSDIRVPVIPPRYRRPSRAADARSRGRHARI